MTHKDLRENASSASVENMYIFTGYSYLGIFTIRQNLVAKSYCLA